MLYVLYCARILLLFCNITVAAVDRVGAGGVVPTLAFFYRIPLLFGAVKCNRSQTATSAERPPVNTRYALRNCDGGQVTTFIERFSANTRYIIGKPNCS